MTTTTTTSQNIAATVSFSGNAPSVLHNSVINVFIITKLGSLLYLGGVH